MTDEEKDRLRAKKVEVISELQAIDISDYGLDEVDDRLVSYLQENRGHPERHNLFELLAVRHFFVMCDRYGFNATAVLQFFALYESLYFPGKRGLQTYELTPVQCFQFASIFAFWTEDGFRVVREVCLHMPRKYSKTTSSASLAIHDLLFGDSNAECYTGANSEDQAMKCFNVIRDCVYKLDPKGRNYQINAKTVKSKRKDKQSFAQCLTANARTKDGLNASTVIMDEFSQAKDANLLTVLTTSMGVRDNPLTAIITTASDVFDGPYYEMLQGYKAILLGDMEDDALFVHIFEPDVDDDESSEDTWRKVHPHMGVTVSMQFYRQEYKKALRSAEQMLAFRTKLLNVFAENERKVWISSTLARRISIPIHLDGLQGRPDAMCAIDLSESDDFSAVTLGMYKAESKTFYFHTAYFFPEGALPNHPNEQLYRVWASKGYLILLPGEVIDYRAIVEYILKANTKVRILNIGYDPWKSQEVINMLSASGASNVVKGVRQTYGNFTAPVESFEHGVKTGHVFINDNPINAYCFGNAVLDEDKLENVKPIKKSQDHKIDGVITMLMCMRLFIDYER
ncbi:MAG: terminase large subunit [Bacteroidales bacterium]|nr:terminase large subunit [Bacteroidales bacterium]